MPVPPRRRASPRSRAGWRSSGEAAADDWPEPPHTALKAEDIELIARRVVELLRELPPGPPPRLVDAAELAHELGVERDWIYAHAAALGAIRLGSPRGRMRFDIAAVRARLAEGQQSDLRRPKRSHNAPAAQRGPMELLPVHVASSAGARTRTRRTRPHR